METLAPYAKAIAAFLTPALTALGVALQSTSDAGSAVSPNEWVGIALAALATSGLVFAIPNKDAEKEELQLIVDQEKAPVVMDDDYEPPAGLLYDEGHGDDADRVPDEPHPYHGERP